MDFYHPCDTSIVFQKITKTKSFLNLDTTLTNFMLVALPFPWFVHFSLMLGCDPKSEPQEFPDLPEIVVPTPMQEAPLSVDETVKHFTISLVGEIRGELEPCGCPTLPYGGFPRRSKALQEIRTEHNTVSLGCWRTLLKGFSATKMSLLRIKLIDW